MKSSLIFTLSAVGLLVTGCSKDLEPNEYAENTLRGGDWRRTARSITYKGPSGKDTTQNYLDMMTECAKDNRLTFQSRYQGKQKINQPCMPGEGPELSFTWNVGENATRLQLNNVHSTFGYTNIDASILELSENKLDLRYRVYINPLSEDVDTVTYRDVFMR